MLNLLSRKMILTSMLQKSHHVAEAEAQTMRKMIGKNISTHLTRVGSLSGTVCTATIAAGRMPQFVSSFETSKLGARVPSHPQNFVLNSYDLIVLKCKPSSLLKLT